jgi:hypothetical protein
MHESRQLGPISKDGLHGVESTSLMSTIGKYSKSGDFRAMTDDPTPSFQE